MSREYINLTVRDVASVIYAYVYVFQSDGAVLMLLTGRLIPETQSNFTALEDFQNIHLLDPSASERQ